MTIARLHRYILLSALWVALPVHAFQSLPFRTPTTTSTTRHFSTGSSSQSNEQFPPEFHRAVECAKHPGLCHVDELMRLSQELEQFDDSCEFVAAKPDDDCEAESLGRLDIADLLRAEGEMIQRRNTIEFSNKFKERVEEQQAHTGTPKAVIDLYSNYYECVYSKTMCGP